MRERDEREVAGDELRRARRRRSPRRASRRHVADVEALDRDDARVGGDGCRELAVSDIHRDHRVGAALAQHLGESAGRAPMSSASAPGDIDVERVEAGDELVRGAADVVVGRRDLDAARRRRPASDAFTTGRPSTVTRPSAMRVAACVRERARPRAGERRVEARGHGARRDARRARTRGGARARRAGPRRRPARVASGCASITSSVESRSACSSSVRRGSDPCPQDTSRRSPRSRRIAHGRWNGSAYSRSGTRNP